MFDFSIGTVLLLAFAAFFGGFMDSIAGGGGLITVPALLLAGFNPVQAIATNKLQGLFGTGSATIAYASGGHVDLKSQLPAAALAFVGAVCGALAITIVPGDMLRGFLPLLLIAVALFFLLKPKISDLDGARRISPLLFGLFVVPVIGFYDGAFGPGTGSFLMLSFVMLAGFGMLKATAHTKLLNFGSNVGGFLTFALAGVVVWKIGFMMGLLQFAGARLGAMLAMKKGARLIRPLLIVVCLALAAKLLTDPANPLRVWLSR